MIVVDKEKKEHHPCVKIETFQHHANNPYVEPP